MTAGAADGSAAVVEGEHCAIETAIVVSMVATIMLSWPSEVLMLARQMSSVVIVTMFRGNGPELQTAMTNVVVSRVCRVCRAVVRRTPRTC